MTREEFKEKWHDMKDKVKAKWTKFTDNEVEEIDGDVDILLSKLEEFYGVSAEQAQMEVDNWFRIT